jgi:type I restriction enzyme M protein
MHWIAPSEKDAAAASLEQRLWAAADQFRANSGLKAQESATATWRRCHSFRRVREATFPVPAIPPCERLHRSRKHADSSSRTETSITRETGQHSDRTIGTPAG